VRGMYFGDLIKTTYKDAYDYTELRQYPSYNELLADLGNGKMDGAFMDSLVMADQKAKGIYNLVTAFTNHYNTTLYGLSCRARYGKNQYEHRVEIQTITSAGICAGSGWGAWRRCS